MNSKPSGLRALELAAQDRARAVGPLLALHVHVAGQARHVRPPGQRRERANVGHRGEVGVVGLLADVAGGEAGEAGAVLEQAVEVGGGNELRVRLAVHVHELREQELDVVFADVALHVLAGARRGEWLVAHRPSKLPARRARGQCANRTHRGQSNCAPRRRGSPHGPTLDSVVSPCVESPDSSPNRST